MDVLRTVDREFREGRTWPMAPPSRFLLNLTERCQLRCAHCITDAPQKTAEGRARDLSRPVLEALAPHLEHAAYVGLVHAGEPMLAPLFDDTLATLRVQRRGAPTVVHLLTNGMAMTPERLTAYAAQGVTSLSVSLDGMSAQSNDALRIGAKVDVLLPRLLGLGEAARAAGVRIGVSTVVTRANLLELPELVRHAARAGLHWLKLEEVFENNAVSSSLTVGRHALDVAVAEARALGEELSVRVLDHTRELFVWKCQLEIDGRMARRSALDDYVNRVEINPCRLPWEQVCIEPDGAMKPLSFHHPSAGNVVDTDLLTLWRGAVCAQVREETLRTRLCGAAGPTTCAQDVGPAAW